MHHLKTSRHRIKRKLAKSFWVSARAVKDNLSQVALLHELKEDPDALIMLEDIFTCDNVLTI